MTLTLDIRPELEYQIKEAATAAGMDAEMFVWNALYEQLQRSRTNPLPSRLSAEEACLLEKINQGLPEAIWQRYGELVAQRRAEALTPVEHSELLSLSDQIEMAHAERMGYLAELAHLRKLPIETVMRQLGIQPRDV